MEFIKGVFVVSALIGALLTIVYVIFGIFTTKKSNLLIEKFAKQFGYRHQTMIFGEMGGIFLWIMKEQLFLNALCFPSSSTTKKIMTSEERDFIRSLPKKETQFIKIKYSLIFVAAFFFVIAIILYLFIKK